MGTPDVERAYEGEDLFRGCFTGVEDAADPSDELSLFDEAQRLLSRALTLLREAFSKSQAELSRCEADLQRLTEERNALKLLNGRKEDEIKDLRAELATAHKEQTDLIEQQKAEKIEQLREKANIMRAETLGWKQNMDHLALEKDTARAQLSSTERQLQSMKEEILARAKKIEELEARLAAELAKEVADTAQSRSYWAAEHGKYQSLRETLKEIHARGFNLVVEIDNDNAKELEAEAKALLSFDA
ncbi:PREDICTED: uncharacterized protein LOC109224135 [Nicotiana attenuata]|uniref:uncharacterized protein LOC109224135 n=1 Tax=Nicotiana attenuata TaxID=49451 RepID=UPI000904E623|nr:PREDICTED: uncharacterized protein LOC109224135 [Nicotiana attenuata]